MTPQHFDLFANLLRAGSGLAIGPDKAYLLETRLAPMMRRERVEGLDALAERLRGPGHPALTREVVEAMTTNESFFFRDDKPFQHVRVQALPGLHARRPARARLRFWSAAASTGQEAYSLAMLVTEARAMLGAREIEILGTDIAREPIERAREGVYTQFEIQRGLPMQMLVKYFRKDGAQWRIADALRGMVTFRVANLLDDLRPLGKFDVVFCRNVLIYFDPPTKTRVLEVIARQMAPDGLLYLGGAETVLGITNQFEPAGTEHGVYSLARSPAAATRAAERMTA